jgi:G3E family GTPase
MADRIVLTKVDRAGSDATAAARAMVAAFNPLATVLTAEAVARDPVILTGGDGPRVWTLDAEPHEHVHTSGIGSVSLLRTGAVSWAGIAAWTAELKERWGADLLRLKALLPLLEEDGPVLVQGVRGLFEMSRLRSWPDDARVGRIVGIGRGLDRASLEEGLMLLGPPALLAAESLGT